MLRAIIAVVCAATLIIGQPTLQSIDSRSVSSLGEWQIPSHPPADNNGHSDSLDDDEQDLFDLLTGRKDATDAFKRLPPITTSPVKSNDGTGSTASSQSLASGKDASLSASASSSSESVSASPTTTPQLGQSMQKRDATRPKQRLDFLKPLSVMSYSTGKQSQRRVVEWELRQANTIAVRLRHTAGTKTDFTSFRLCLISEGQGTSANGKQCFPATLQSGGDVARVMAPGWSDGIRSFMDATLEVTPDFAIIPRSLFSAVLEAKIQSGRDVTTLSLPIGGLKFFLRAPDPLRSKPRVTTVSEVPLAHEVAQYLVHDEQAKLDSKNGDPTTRDEYKRIVNALSDFAGTIRRRHNVLERNLQFRQWNSPRIMESILADLKREFTEKASTALQHVRDRNAMIADAGEFDMHGYFHQIFLQHLCADLAQSVMAVISKDLPQFVLITGQSRENGQVRDMSMNQRVTMELKDVYTSKPNPGRYFFPKHRLSRLMDWAEHQCPDPSKMPPEGYIPGNEPLEPDTPPGQEHGSVYPSSQSDSPPVTPQSGDDSSGSLHGFGAVLDTSNQDLPRVQNAALGPRQAMNPSESNQGKQQYSNGYAPAQYQPIRGSTYQPFGRQQLAPTR